MAEAPDAYSDLDLSDSEDDSEFAAAAERARSLVPRLGPDALLRIYSLYKQATEGPCDVPRPKWYEARAKRKWDAWNSLGDTPPDAARREYVALVSEIDPDWKAKPRESTEGWAIVSSLRRGGDSDDADDTVFDRCKRGDVRRVRELLDANPECLNALDPNGLGLIHWAADRGLVDMIAALVEAKCDVSLRDESGQTALHYASSCGHVDCVVSLIESGIDKSSTDKDGLTAADLASDENIRNLLA